jgi:hypothetical protein
MHLMCRDVLEHLGHEGEAREILQREVANVGLLQDRTSVAAHMLQRAARSSTTVQGWLHE